MTRLSERAPGRRRFDGLLPAHAGIAANIVTFPTKDIEA
jgi:hypothetical protein